MYPSFVGTAGSESVPFLLTLTLSILFPPFVSKVTVYVVATEPPTPPPPPPVLPEDVLIESASLMISCVASLSVPSRLIPTV